MIRQRHHHHSLLEYLRHLYILRYYHQASTTRGGQLLHHRISDKPAGVETYPSKLLLGKTIVLSLLAKLICYLAGEAYQLNLPAALGTEFR